MPDPAMSAVFPATISGALTPRALPMATRLIVPPVYTPTNMPATLFDSGPTAPRNSRDPAPEEAQETSDVPRDDADGVADDGGPDLVHDRVPLPEPDDEHGHEEAEGNGEDGRDHGVIPFV